VNNGLHVRETGATSRRLSGSIGLELPKTLSSIRRLHEFHGDAEERAPVPSAIFLYELLEPSPV
jgi:hypothetical protein